MIAGRPRHALVVGHEEGWAEVWRYLALWVEDRARPNVDHSNGDGSWDDLHPASATRQLATLQLSGYSDYVARGARLLRRCQRVMMRVRCCRG